MKQRNGNKDRATHNIGHDVAKTRLSAKLNLDIYEVRKLLLNHPEIKLLLEKQAIRIGQIVGQNFTVGAKDKLLKEYRHVNAVNADVTVIQAVNNILNSIMKQLGVEGYGKTQFWKNLDPSKYTYNKRIYVGGDILTYNWTQATYTQKQFTCKLNDKQKNEKYQRGA